MSCGGRACQLADGREQYPPMPKQDANIFEILISQMGERRDIYSVLGKASRVLGHAELFEPVRNLLHRGHRQLSSPTELPDHHGREIYSPNPGHRMTPGNSGQAGYKAAFISRTFRCLSGVCMPASKTYNRYAARCLEEARNAPDQKLKAFLIEMAHEWQRLAQQATSIEGGRQTEAANLPPDQGD